MDNYTQKVKRFFSHLVLALAIFSICRILFFAFNSSYFSGVDLSIFISGLRFDLSALFWILLPFWVLGTLEWVIDLGKWASKAKFFIFQLGIGLSTLVNCIDLEYFKFTQKRSTADLFAWFEGGEDIYGLIPTFLSDFWYVILVYLFIMAFSIIAYRKIEKHVFKSAQKQNRNWIQKLALAICTLGFLFVGGRGGFQLIPIGIVDASMFATPQNIPLVLNTPFTIIRTWGKNQLDEVNFMSLDKEKKLFNPIVEPNSGEEFQKKNVVVIILESFSIEFAGDSEKAKKLTPFLQSLKNKSIYMNHCFANGKKSIEALPAILSGIPSLSNYPYINSGYSNNKIESFATYLKKYGYYSSFFHGGKNGTMNFNGYINSAGFDAYFGKDEYPNQQDYDGKWGIFDEPYLQYFCHSLSTMQQPFVSCVFTLSSHHPYTIPKPYKNTFTGGETPLENTVQYTDMSLKKFFECAQKENWYKNTVFVITADHAPFTNSEKYQRTYELFHIPLLIFDPKNDTGKVIDKTCQQTDILPTIMDYLNYPKPVFSFGQSIFNKEKGYAVQFLNNNYQLIEDSSIIIINQKNVLGYYNPRTDPLLTKNLLNQSLDKAKLSEEKLRAYIQCYNRRMIQNQLVAP